MSIRWTDEDVAEYYERQGKTYKPQKVKSIIPQPINQGEASLAFVLAHYAPDLPAPQWEESLVGQYRFDPQRKWELDFAWVPYRLCVEVHGDVHKLKDKRQKDCEKWTALALDGWLILHYTTEQVRDDPAGCCDKIRMALAKQGR